MEVAQALQDIAVPVPTPAPTSAHQQCGFTGEPACSLEVTGKAPRLEDLQSSENRPTYADAFDRAISVAESNIGNDKSWPVYNFQAACESYYKNNVESINICLDNEEASFNFIKYKWRNASIETRRKVLRDQRRIHDDAYYFYRFLNNSLDGWLNVQYLEERNRRLFQQRPGVNYGR